MKIYGFTLVLASILAVGPPSADAKPAKKAIQSATDKVAAKVAALPQSPVIPSTVTDFDWLLTPEKAVAGVYAAPDGKSIVITNGLVSRTVRLFPAVATTDFVNHMTGESMLRAVSPEGTVTIDGKRMSIGGLDGQPERAYINEAWLASMTATPGAFVLDDIEVRPMHATINFDTHRWALNKKQPTGREAVLTMHSPVDPGLKLRVHIGVFDGLPVIRKNFELINETGKSVNIDSFELERLAMAEPESLAEGTTELHQLPNIHVESDLACRGAFTERETDRTEHWLLDSAYTSQRSYLRVTPCILQVAPEIGPDVAVEPGETFASFNVYEMPFDSGDRERKGLFTRRMYRTIAPWTTQNPIFLHLTSTDSAQVHRAVDQCAATGYEMIILSFGSGLNIEDDSEANIRKFKSYVDYARSKGIEMGCYSLLASRSIADSIDVIDPKTGKPGGAKFGSSPCVSSDWGHTYLAKIKNFFERTGMKCFEHDGSYPGDLCASTTHAHHKGLNDSQWTQFKTLTDLYHWMCENGIYLNVPDFYFLNGSTKVGIGYREDNWSLPRDRQIIHTRQLNYDCTFERLQSALWSFVPLVQYHGGGEAATLEPLSEHLYEYRTLMYQNYGAGVQACYRGPRLYDTPETQAVVTEVIDWYKKYRDILNSDIIHLRRPDARDWDGIMHVSPNGQYRALAMVFNPTDEPIVRDIKLPLYYTGLDSEASIRQEEGAPARVKLNRDYSIDLKAEIPARGFTWYVIEP